MQRKIDQFATVVCAMLVVAALLACKKRSPVGAIPSAASAAAEPAVTPAPLTPPTTAPTDAGPKLGDVKRYADKEKAQTGAARILENNVKVYNEADDKTAEVATLDKGLLVFRLASLPDWELVEFPSGVGKVSPGWVQAKLVDSKSDAAVARDAVAAQPQQAAVKAASSAAPKASASASGKPAASTAAASSTAKPAVVPSAALPLPLNSATLSRTAAAAARAAAQAKAAADKAAAGLGGKSAK